jgi:hypothetical protein
MYSKDSNAEIEAWKTLPKGGLSKLLNKCIHDDTCGDLCLHKKDGCFDYIKKSDQGNL